MPLRESMHLTPPKLLVVLTLTAPSVGAFRRTSIEPEKTQRFACRSTLLASLWEGQGEQILERSIQRPSDKINHLATPVFSQSFDSQGTELGDNLLILGWSLRLLPLRLLERLLFHITILRRSDYSRDEVVVLIKHLGLNSNLATELLDGRVLDVVVDGSALLIAMKPGRSRLIICGKWSIYCSLGMRCLWCGIGDHRPWAGIHDDVYALDRWCFTCRE